MTSFPLLSAVLLAPICAAVILCFVSPKAAQSVRVIAASAMTVALALTLYAFFSYDMTAGGKCSPPVIVQPIICFFFSSNSSCVIIPFSRKSFNLDIFTMFE